jgi:hypothetical protein
MADESKATRSDGELTKTELRIVDGIPFTGEIDHLTRDLLRFPAHGSIRQRMPRILGDERGMTPDEAREWIENVAAPMLRELVALGFLDSDDVEHPAG